MRQASLLLSLFLCLACSDDTESTGGKDGGVPPADQAVNKDGKAALDQKVKPDLSAPDLTTPDMPGPPSCKAGSKTGKTGSTNGELSSGGVKFNVRVPASYKATVGAPLIMVYAAAGGTADNMEPFTGLTTDGNKRGYIVAFVDHVSPNNYSGVQDIAQIPGEIAKKWCVDTARIYMTGHSNGGSVIYIMLARNNWYTHYPAAIAPSAAGMSAAAFKQFPCPKTSPPAMVLHSSNDTLFPGFGKDARDWWVSCKKCSKTATTTTAGCKGYSGCGDGSTVHYCETSGSHGTWPKLNSAMLDFFARYRSSK